MMRPWVEQSLTVLDKEGLHPCAMLRVGSHSHGTHIPPTSPDGVDDVDVLVVLRPDIGDALGFAPRDDFRHQHGELDLFAYSWGKFIRLLLKSNPNVLGCLWLPKDCEYTPKYDETFANLKAARSAFVTRQAHQSFVGYARAQLHKMKSQAYQGYMGEKRKALVDRYGYDTKNAAHLIRLLRMAVEFLRTGDLVVRRPDAEEIIAIKCGGWTLDQVEQEAQRLFALADDAWALSMLPDHPDKKWALDVMLRGYGEWEYVG